MFLVRKDLHNLGLKLDNSWSAKMDHDRPWLLHGCPVSRHLVTEPRSTTRYPFFLPLSSCDRTCGTGTEAHVLVSDL